MIINRFFLSLMFLFGGIMCSSSQTYLYKRVMVVQNGNRRSKNDDAHYITFNNKGFYESDRNGYKNGNSSFVEFIKDQNNLHCYFGKGYYGENHYYFSRDYSRLNVKIDNATTYVYQRESSGTTTASRRKIVERNASNNIVTPTITSPQVINSSSDKRHSNSSTHKSMYETCNICNGTRICNSCNGTGGEWKDTGYYIGEYNPSWIECASCKGRKTCWRCHGRGKLYAY